MKLKEESMGIIVPGVVAGIVVLAGVGGYLALNAKESKRDQHKPQDEVRQAITDSYKSPNPALQPAMIIYEKNILGNAESETFVEINGNQYFYKIDGQDVRNLYNCCERTP